MSEHARFAARTIFELLLTLAGWGLVIAAVVFLFMSQFVLAVGLFVGGMIAFFIAAKSFKSKPSSHYFGSDR